MFAFLRKFLLSTFCSFTSCDSMALLLSSLQLSPKCTPIFLPVGRPPCSRIYPGEGQTLWSPRASPRRGSTCRGQVGSGILCKVLSLPNELSKLMEALSAKWFHGRTQSWISEIMAIAWIRVQSPSGIIWRSSDVQSVPPDLAGGRLEVIFHLTPVKPCLPLVSCY